MKICILRQIQQNHILSSPCLRGLCHSPVLDLMSPWAQALARAGPSPALARTAGAVPLGAPLAQLLNRTQEGKTSFPQNPTQQQNSTEQHMITVRTE